MYDSVTDLDLINSADQIITFTLVIVAIASLMSAVVAVLTFLRLSEVNKLVIQVEHNSNSIKDELVRLAKESSFAAGKKAAKDEAARDREEL